MSASTKNRKLRPRCPHCNFRVDDIAKHLPRCTNIAQSHAIRWHQPKRISK